METEPNTRIYSHSRVWALAIVLVITSVSVWLVIRGWQTRSWLWYSVAAILMLGLFLFRRMISARFRATNWLVQSNDSGLFIQFRSYLNHHFPADDPTIVFIPYSQIRSARLLRERNQTLDASGETTVQKRHLVEFDLAGNVRPLAEALVAERARHAPIEKRWYGKSSSMYREFPVSIDSPPMLRVEWSGVPGAKSFLESMRRHTRVEGPVSTSKDLSNLSALPFEEQTKRLGELDSQGQTVLAIQLARQLYGCSLAEAKARIEELRVQKSAGAAP